MSGVFLIQNCIRICILQNACCSEGFVQLFGSSSTGAAIRNAEGDILIGQQCCTSFYKQPKHNQPLQKKCNATYESITRFRMLRGLF